ncbi:MAG: hypothetical protein U0793_17400 [Gemmataceae bacterium]
MTGQARAIARARQTTTASLLESLVRDNALTTYQAKQITLGAGAPPRVGQYLILDELGRQGLRSGLGALHTSCARRAQGHLAVPDRERARPLLVSPRGSRRDAASALNVVMAYDANEVDGVLFLVMESSSRD